MQTQRLQSLDFFRGITVVAMILVNNPGSWDSVYTPLLHAKWNGCTPTDLVFPFFLFIVGVSIHFAYKSKKHEGTCTLSGFGFKPFAMDVFGVLAPRSVSFLKRICNKLMHLYDYPSHVASAIVNRRISFAVQLGVARQFYMLCA